MKAIEFKISLNYNGGSTHLTCTETHKTLNACLNSVKNYLKKVMYQQPYNTSNVCITFDGKKHNYFFISRGNRLFLNSFYTEGY